MSVHPIDWQDISTWRVLVIDDEPDNIEVVAESLEFYGVLVRTAENGKVGLEVLPGFAPNVILLDLSMPVMDGWHTLRQLRSDPETSNLPVIALSAHAILGDQERALEVGFNGYMTKPVNLPTLLDDIRKAAVQNTPRPVTQITRMTTGRLPAASSPDATTQGK